MILKKQKSVTQILREMKPGQSIKIDRKSWNAHGFAKAAGVEITTTWKLLPNGLYRITLTKTK